MPIIAGLRPWKAILFELCVPLNRRIGFKDSFKSALNFHPNAVLLRSQAVLCVLCEPVTTH